MKNLKKVFSLVLVLVMVCGLCVSASATSFTDDADINYTEAVDVLSGVGILAGYTDGSFAPQGDVTRAQAAKIITYLLIGKGAAEALTNNVSPFVDVPANHWAAGFIQYCVNNGILNGVGEGKFDPNGKVTNAQYAKMLLAALGYGTEGEFVGSNWKTAVTKYAVAAKIFNGNFAANPDGFANREETAQYTFNAMQAAKVKYNNLLGDYMNEGAGVFGTVENTNTFMKDYGLSKVKGTLDGDLEIEKVAVDADGADIGRAGYVWTQNGKAVTGVVFTDTVLATKTNGSDLEAWTTKGNRNYVAPKGDKVTVYVNGVEDDKGLYEAKAGDKAVIIGDKAVELVLITTYSDAFQIGKTVPTADKKTGKVELNGTKYDAKFVVGLDAIAAGDVVYLNTNEATKITTVIKANPVAGQKTAQKGTTVTFGGATYTGINAAVNTKLAELGFNTDATLYLGSGGYVVAVIGAKAPEQVIDRAILIDAAVTKDNSDPFAPTTGVQVKMLKTDGTVVVVNAKAIMADKDTKIEFTNKIPTESTDKWYTYTVDKDGLYTFTAETTTAINGEIKNTVSYAAGVKANNKTVFIVKTVDNKGAVKYNTYTGYAAVPAMKEDATGWAVVAKDGFTTIAYISKGTAKVPTAQADTAFILDKDPTLVGGGPNGAPLYTYQAIVKGAVVTLKATANQGLVKAGLYEVKTDANEITTIDKDTVVSYEFGEGKDTLVAKDGVVTINNNSYVYTANTVVYVYDSNAASNEDALKTIDVEAIGEYESGNFAYVLNAKNADTVDVIYIVD